MPLDPKSYRERLERSGALQDQKVPADTSDVEFDVSRGLPPSSVGLKQIAEKLAEGLEEPEKPAEEDTPEEKLSRSLKPLSLEEYLVSGRVHQDVPILHGKQTITFESITGEDVDFLNDFMTPVEDNPKSTTAAVTTRFILAKLALSIRSINGVDYPPIRDENGRPTKDRMEAKIKKLQGKGLDYLNLLYKHLVWFEGRIGGLLNEDAVKKV